MTPVERLEAAILKLERLKAAGLAEELFDRLMGYYYGEPSGEHEMMITLRRTVDAQLAMLRYGYRGADDLARHGTPDEPEGTRLAIALADAILGDNS